MINLFREIPGLLVVIPAVIALRGNINTALGSRLGSAYHLGIIDAENLWNEELKQNILGSLILSFILSFIIGLLAYISSIFLQIYPNPLILISIVIVAGGLSGIILAFLTIIIIYIVFKRGYDPDNITGPALSTFGDIITILCIFLSAILIGGFA
jgi:mgtE-like transporter